MAIIRGRQMGLDMPTFAKQFKTSKSVIWATSNTPNLSKATGRPSKTSSGDDRITVRMSKKNPRLTSTNINSELKDQYGVQDSVQGHCQKTSAPRETLQKAPSEQANNSGEEPFSLTEVGKGSSALKWNKVLWSDESKYLMINTEGIIHVRRPVDKRYDPKYQVPSVKHCHGVGLLPRKWRRPSYPNHRNHEPLRVQEHLGEGNAAIWKISDGSWVVIPTGQRSEAHFPLRQGLVCTASSKRFDLAKPISRPESHQASLGGPW
uniref:Uncharacterized protein n=1 Tax=Caenorhabditis japonica TaxID=281687 RepID=A0A8R1I671_CAEJA